MNYVVLNGVNSNTIRGLLIQELPPVSKPLMRTEIEEIDGRDGDIVTKLGYSAYNKEMLIGLRGDYDIDDVINFFDSEGTVVFSNEMDKFYYYQIIEQIDFERLVRFRTATVIFHVQPFKYSAVDNLLKRDMNMINIPNFQRTTNGITVRAIDGEISVSGTGSQATEFYIPIDPLTLQSGHYTLKVQSTGTSPESITVRLVGNVATDADSFGHTSMSLHHSFTRSISATLSQAETYGYIWLYISGGVAIDATAYFMLFNNAKSSFSVINRGNVNSRPKLTIHGSGSIRLRLNGDQILVISLGTSDYIVIDSAQMNAYKGEALMNRSVVGDYKNLSLKTGKNTISWLGNVTKIEIENYSRWV